MHEKYRTESLHVKRIYYIIYVIIYAVVCRLSRRDCVLLFLFLTRDARRASDEIALFFEVGRPQLPG